MNNIELLNYFPEKLRTVLKKYILSDNTLEEVRLRAEKSMMIKTNNFEIITNIIINTEDILETLENICEHSIYTYQNQICNGYITVKGGHRVGIVGNVVIENNKVINIKYVSSLNFRIANQVLNCSNKLLPYILNIEENTIYNTLIVASPGVRKNYNITRLNKKNK